MKEGFKKGFGECLGGIAAWALVIFTCVAISNNSQNKEKTEQEVSIEGLEISIEVSFIFASRRIIMDEGIKEVYFHKYCKNCQYRDNKEDEEPCDECLNEPWNTNSHKPLYFKDKEV